MKDINFNTILFYLKNKRDTISKMLKCYPPVDSDKMRGLYEIYFNSFISVFEYITNDLQQRDYQSKIETSLKSADNYMYIREFRNGFIHRGLDLSMSGEVIEELNIVVPVAPNLVYGKHKKDGTQKEYHKFTDNLFQLVILCEDCNKIIYDFCNANNLINLINTTNEEYLTELKKFDNIPDFVYDFVKTFDFTKIYNKTIYDKQIKEAFDTSDIITNEIRTIFFK